MLKRPKRRAKQRGEKKATLKVLRMEVKRVGNSPEENVAMRKEILDYCVMVQEINNFVWAFWSNWHFANDSRQQLSEWYDSWKEWASLSKEERDATPQPRNPVVPIPKELDFYGECARRWIRLNTETLAATIKRVNILTRPSSKGNLSGWISILLHRDQLPTHTHPLPIGFSASTCSVNVPLTEDDHHVLKIKIGRIPPENGKKVGTAISYECHLWDRGYGMCGRREVMKKIAMGEYTIRGSQLLFDDGKLYADIAYEEPDDKVSFGSKPAILFSSPTTPLTISVDGGKESPLWVGPLAVEKKRRQLDNQRLTRSQCFKYSPTKNTKGHGRKRSNSKRSIIGRLWRHYTKTSNQQMAASVFHACKTRGVGSVVLDFSTREKSFLSTTGKNMKGGTSWDWSGLEVCIKNKLRGHVDVLTQAEFEAKQTNKEAKKSKSRRSARSAKC